MNADDAAWAGLGAAWAGLFLFLVVYLVASVTTGLIGYAVASSKGRGGLGFVLGFLLSVIGIVVAALLEPSPQELQRRQILTGATPTQVLGSARVGAADQVPGFCGNCKQPISGELCTSCGHMNRRTTP